jgi:molybdopterin/thiamine biosynthesis adenylyltransferase/rhodanese-related sulfurtransferase
MERYNRQYLLKELGKTGQEALLNAKVLVVGAGGLGCGVLPYLAAAGIGKIGIVDGDKISLSNLQRQVLYFTEDVGHLKVKAAVKRLSKLNPEIEIVPYPFYLNTENAANIVRDFDIVVDCTDNFSIRYLLSDLTKILRKPLVYAAIYKFEGQVAVFNSKPTSASYRSLFPFPPTHIPNCNEVGVIGVLPGVLGNFQANEVIKLITNIGFPLDSKVFTINLLNYQTYTLSIPAVDAGNYPKTIEELKQFDYSLFCNEVEQISPEDFMKNMDAIIVDVRNLDELPRLKVNHYAIPLLELESRIQELPIREIIVVCQSGIRSKKGVSILKEYLTQSIKSLKGGVNALNL